MNFDDVDDWLKANAPLMDELAEQEEKDKTMTEDQLKEIEARLNAATPGPWAPISDMPSWAVASFNAQTDVVTTRNRQYRSPGVTNYGCRLHDADFIAAAPTDIAALLAEVRRLNRDVQTLIEEGIENHNKLAIATEALEFYASPENWEWTDDCGQFSWAATIKGDIWKNPTVDEGGGTDYAGRHAREALEKLK